jgi:hypothetical protein
MFLFETYHSKDPNPIYKIELNKILKKRYFFFKKKKSFEVFTSKLTNIKPKYRTDTTLVMEPNFGA